MRSYTKTLNKVIVIGLLSVVLFISCSDDNESSLSPTSPSSRFTDNGDGTVTDNTSKLVWLKDANCAGKENWWDALAWARQLTNGKCGLSDRSLAGDWHLPTLSEFLTLIDRTRGNPALPLDHPFMNVQFQLNAYVFYWTATDLGQTRQALFMDIASGADDLISKDMSNYMWPVRRR